MWDKGGKVAAVRQLDFTALDNKHTMRVNNLRCRPVWAGGRETQCRPACLGLRMPDWVEGPARASQPENHFAVVCRCQGGLPCRMTVCTTCRIPGTGVVASCFVFSPVSIIAFSCCFSMTAVLLLALSELWFVLGSRIRR